MYRERKCERDVEAVGERESRFCEREGGGGCFVFVLVFVFWGKQVNCKKGYFVNYKGFLVRARPGTRNETR